MYNEMSFLFNKNIKGGKFLDLDASQPSNENTLWNEKKTTNSYAVYKDAVFFNSQSGQIQNYIKEKIYDNDDSDTNPYISLLKDQHFQVGSRKLKPSYFTYLRDLGVYPLNRLIILRRYPEGVAVHDDLERISATPISTVVGWVKEDYEIFDITFNEEWTTEKRYLHEVIYDILQNEFKIGGADKVIPQPGWTQGILFGFLKEMGLTQSDAYDIPFGDPNLLREAATRDYTQQTLKSTMDIIFETVYEQKFIGDFDPATAMVDIIRNLTDMGTSNTRFIFDGNSPILNKLSNAISGKGNNTSAWAVVIKEIIDAYIKAVTNITTELFGGRDDSKTTGGSENNGSDLDKQISDLEQANINLIDTTGTVRLSRKDKDITFKDKKSRDNYEDNLKKIKSLQDQQKLNIKNESNKEKAKEKDNKSKAYAEVDKLNSDFSFLDDTSTLGKLLKSVLASTFAKHRWPLRGSIAAMTGQPSAPWHITIGNPWSPIISSGNMIVEKIQVTGKGEMGFNDMPLQITAKINVRFGRNLGKQEIQSIFNNGYQRIYSKNKPSTTQKQDNTTTNNTK